MERYLFEMPMMIPAEELEYQYYSGCENRQKNIKELSKQYVEKHVKCETYKEHYRTVMDSRIKINVYSKYPLSNEEIYAISSSYQHMSQFESCLMKDDFSGYLTWCYSEFEDIRNIENRIHLYEYWEDYLLIILDVEPEKLGFDATIIEWTKYFNVKKDTGKYQTLIKAYTDFDILVTSVKPLLIKEVISIVKSHKKAQSYVIEGEIGATCREFLSALKDTEVSREIKSYEYHYSFLAIEIK